MLPIGDATLQAVVSFSLPTGGTVLGGYPGRIDLEGIVSGQGEVLVYGLAEVVVLYQVPGLGGEPSYQVQSFPCLVRSRVPVEVSRGGEQVAVTVSGSATEVKSEGVNWMVTLNLEVLLTGRHSEEASREEREEKEITIRPFAAVVAEELKAATEAERADVVHTTGEFLPAEERIVAELKEFERYLGRLPKGRIIISINGVNYVIEGTAS